MRKSAKFSRKGIKDMPISDQPLEKLQAKGSENLTDVELLAIILGTGTQQRNVLALARLLLQQYPLRSLSTINTATLAKIPGIGRTKAGRITACIELGMRMFAPSQTAKITITTTEAALDQVREIAHKRQEHMVVLFINARNELIKKETLGIGTINAAVVEPRDILSQAVVLPCTSIIIAHNHPSGDPTPSDDDVRFTARLQQAASIMGITLADHLIVSQTGYFSFHDTPFEAVAVHDHTELVKS